LHFSVSSALVQTISSNSFAFGIQPSMNISVLLSAELVRHIFISSGDSQAHPSTSENYGRKLISKEDKWAMVSLK
jgi:hypothetical protein